jgi:hypothetical protein
VNHLVDLLLELIFSLEPEKRCQVVCRDAGGFQSLFDLAQSPQVKHAFAPLGAFLALAKTSRAICGFL